MIVGAGLRPAPTFLNCLPAPVVGPVAFASWSGALIDDRDCIISEYSINRGRNTIWLEMSRDEKHGGAGWIFTECLWSLTYAFRWDFGCCQRRSHHPGETTRAGTVGLCNEL